VVTQSPLPFNLAKLDEFSTRTILAMLMIPKRVLWKGEPEVKNWLISTGIRAVNGGQTVEAGRTVRFLKLRYFEKVFHA